MDGTEKFGVENFQLIAENAGGSVDTQAGSHPFQLTSVVTFNTTAPEPGGGPRTVALAKDIVSELPAGLIADPAGLAQCTQGQFARERCLAQSAIGVAAVTFDEPGVVAFDSARAPIFNIEPSPGEPARFGVMLAGIPEILGTSIRSGRDYGVTLASNNITQDLSLLSLQLTFWGVPGDQRHDAQRGWECLEGSGTCTPTATSAPPPFLSLPSTCGKPLQSTLSGEQWERPGKLEALASYQMPSLDRCDQLPFEPQIAVSPEARQGSEPTGLNVDLHVPQGEASNPAGLTDSNIEDIAVALPEGLTIDPAAAGRMEACSEGLIGFEGFQEIDPTSDPGVQTPIFTSRLPGSPPAPAAGEAEPLQPGVNFCPDASKIGTVEIHTPLLADPLKGAMYLAAPQNLSETTMQNPFGSLVAVYLVAEDPVSGVLVELPGRVTLNQQTGQLTMTLENTPQLPLEDIELKFLGGERALLATPARCGTYTTQASFTPWSGEPPVPSTSSFEITSGPNGAPCPGPSLPFAPSITAGTTNLDSGAFSPLTATISRGDGQQSLRGFQLRLPPGLEGLVSSVPLCQEAQANAGACAAASQIGETTVSAGVGGDPYTLTGGKVYLTEGYEGAPFGLAIVTPVKAGPLDLEDAPENHPACDCLVIRAKIEVDPRTAQLTIATGRIPTIIDGIPLQIKHLNITIDRRGFIVNPTSCAHLPLTGTISGNEGAGAPVSSSFQAANCAALKFAPKLTASTQAKTSRGGGASLSVKLSYPSGPHDANIAALKVDLPEALPARLRTLRQACLARVFQANPAACPAGSIVGRARVLTPILPGVGGGLLTGPAYFVGRGPGRFPGLVLVLSGDGVRLDLAGRTFIDARTDVTSLTFKTVPDIPVSSLELTLPEGPHSALATNAALCKRKLAMPTALVGQNGAEIHESTKVRVIGCPASRARKPLRRTKHYKP